MTQNSFLSLIEQSIRNNWNAPAMTDFQGKTYYYKDLARVNRPVTRLFSLLLAYNRGDKISLCGKNSSHWAIVFLPLSLTEP